MATSLTASFALAQSDAASTVQPVDAVAIEAAVEALPLSTSTVLDTLSDAARADVESICLPVQYQSGAIAYRDCIVEQLNSQTSTASATVPATSLSFDEEYAIQQTCQNSGPVNSTAYRACDEAQLASLAGVPEPALDRITEDETYAVQLGCYDDQMNDGVKAYRECINDSINQLLALPRPNLSTLTLVERNALQLRCSAQNTSAVSYRNCLLGAVDGATLTDRQVDTSVEPAEQQNDMEPFAGTAEPTSPQSATESATESTTESTTESASMSAAETGANSEEPQSVLTSDVETTETPAAEVQAIATAEAIRLPEADSLALEDVEPVAEAPEDAGQTTADLLIRLKSTLSGMDDMTRMLMWTAIGLPILLTLLWLLLRGRKPASEPETSYPEYPISNGVDTAPHRPSSMHRMAMTDDDTAEFPPRESASTEQVSASPRADDDNASGFSAQMDELFGQPASQIDTLASRNADEEISSDHDSRPDPVKPATVPTALASSGSRPTLEPVAAQANKSISERAPTQNSDTTPTAVSNPDQESSPGPLARSSLDSRTGAPSTGAPSPELPSLHDFTLTPATERDDYLAWLSVQDEAKQQTLAIEFLIYWMAYSDERYPPELKKKIFQLQDPGDHDLIKRWTLKQDVHAFAGNLQWLQYNLSTEQHEQIINLLMALLVSENALTPAQNTLLRFLADAFGLGVERLDALFQTAFAQPMPALPRLDKPDWWKRQPADTLKRWDARSVSRQRSDIRYRVALGLPLGSELDSESIMASFRRAAKRCQPERFNRLSSREQNLAAKQLEKYEMAAESLLEVSA